MDFHTSSCIIRKIDENVSVVYDLKSGNILTINNELFNLLRTAQEDIQLLQKEIEVLSDLNTAQNTVAFLLQNNIITNNYTKQFDEKILADNDYSELVLCLNNNEKILAPKIVEKCNKIFSERQIKKVLIYSEAKAYRKYMVDLLNNLYKECAELSLGISLDDFLALYNENEKQLDCFSELYITCDSCTSKMILFQDESAIRKNILQKIIIQPIVNPNNYQTIHTLFLDLLFLGIKFKFDPISYYHYIGSFGNHEPLTDKQILKVYWNILSSLQQAEIYRVPDEFINWLERTPYKNCGAGTNQLFVGEDGELYICNLHYKEKNNFRYKCYKARCSKCSICEACGMNCVFKNGECSRIKAIIENQIVDKTDSSKTMLERIENLL